MLIIVSCIIVGTLTGHRHARRLGGNRSDRTHYSLVHGILFGLFGVFITIILGWSVS